MGKRSCGGRGPLLIALALAGLGLGAVVALSAGPARAHAGGANIAVDPGARRVSPGGVITFAVVVRAPAQPLQGVDAYLDFAPTYLQVVDAQGNPAAALEPGSTLPVILQNRANIALGGQAITGTFTLATLRFRCLAPIPIQGTPIVFAFDAGAHRITEIGYLGASVLESYRNGVAFPAQPRLVLPLLLKYGRRFRGELGLKPVSPYLPLMIRLHSRWSGSGGEWGTGNTEARRRWRAGLDLWGRCGVVRERSAGRYDPTAG